MTGKTEEEKRSAIENPMAANGQGAMEKKMEIAPKNEEEGKPQNMTQQSKGLQPTTAPQEQIDHKLNLQKQEQDREQKDKEHEEESPEDLFPDPLEKTGESAPVQQVATDQHKNQQKGVEAVKAKGRGGNEESSEDARGVARGGAKGPVS